MDAFQLYFVVTKVHDEVTFQEGPFLSYDQANAMKDCMPDEFVSCRVAKLTIPFQSMEIL